MQALGADGVAHDPGKRSNAQAALPAPPESVLREQGLRRIRVGARDDDDEWYKSFKV